MSSGSRRSAVAPCTTGTSPPRTSLELAHPPNILRHQPARTSENSVHAKFAEPLRQRNVTGTAPEAFRCLVLSTSHKRNSPNFITPLEMGIQGDSGNRDEGGTILLPRRTGAAG